MYRSDSERGGTLILVAIMLVTLLSFLALVVDVGAGYIERRRIQGVADAAALAGVQWLVNNHTDGQILAAVHKYGMLENPPGANETRPEPTVKWLVGTTIAGTVGVDARPAGVTGIQVTVTGSTPTFFANLLGITQVSASATGGAGYSPLDLVLVLDKSTSMMYDSVCDFANYFSTPAACKGVVDSVDTSNGLYISCDDCGGMWATPTHAATPRPLTPTPTRLPKCYWPNGGLMTPVPAKCKTPGVGTQANCQACQGDAEPWQPMTDAQAAAVNFVDLVQEQLPAYPDPSFARLGLVTYSTRACSPTTNHPCQNLAVDLSTVSAAISSIAMTLPTPWYYTNCEEGLSTARGYLNSGGRATAVKAIVFMTDGIANRCIGGSSCSNAIQKAKDQATLAKADGIKIFTIGLGVDADQDMLKVIAKNSGASGPSDNAGFLYAPTGADLAAAYAEMFAKIKRLRLVQ